MSNNNLCFGLKNELKSREIKTFLSELFIDFEFYDLDSDTQENEKNIQNPNACTYTFGKDKLMTDFKYTLDLNFPVKTRMNNESELFIATKFSNRFNSELIVAGDYYNETAYPNSWILVSKNKYYELIERTNEKGLSEFDIKTELNIELKITKAQQCV